MTLLSPGRPSCGNFQIQNPWSAGAALGQSSCATGSPKPTSMADPSRNATKECFPGADVQPEPAWQAYLAGWKGQSVSAKSSSRFHIMGRAIRRAPGRGRRVGAATLRPLVRALRPLGLVLRPLRPAVRRLQDARIGTKVIGMVLVTSSIFVGVGLIGVSRTRQLSDRADDLYQQKVAGLTHISQVRASVSAVQQAVLLHFLSGTAADQGQWQSVVTQNDAKIQQDLGALRQLRWDAWRASQLDAFDRAFAKWRGRRDDALAASSKDGSATVRSAEFYQAQVLVGDAVRGLDALFVSVVDDVRESADQAHRSAVRSEQTMLVLLVAGVALALLLAVLAASAISRPLRRTVRILKAVAAGDLTQQLRVTSRDEVGQVGAALNQTLELLRATVRSISDNVTALSTASDELAVVSGSMSASAEETSTQAAVASIAAGQVSANVQTVAAAAEELNSSIRQVAQHAMSAASVAESGAGQAREANATVGELSTSSTQIEAVVQLIHGIAGQTHLLALNATIEAARAGESGRGFAVVANEVKELAQATAKATDEVGRAVLSIQQGSGNATAGIVSIADVIDRVYENQATIAAAVEEQTATTNEIGASAMQAAAGSSEIARNISAVAQAARGATAGAAQTEAAAQELSRMAGDLRGLVGQFRC